MNPDLRRLEPFLAVVEAGSINRAAKARNITQAGLTKSIRALEAQLGSVLFARTPHGVRLTRQGHQFLRHARLIRNQCEMALKSITALASGLDAELRVGVSMRWALRQVMPGVLARCAQDPRRPRITIVTNRKSWQMIEDLRDGELDLLLATPTEQDNVEGFDIRYYRPDPQSIVVRRGHPLAGRGRLELSDLTGCDWISSPPETYYRRYLEALFMTEGLAPPEPLLVSDSSALILDTIARTDLLGIATEGMIRVDHFGRIVALDTPGRADRTTAILTRTGDVLPDTAESLIQAIGEALGGAGAER